MKVLKVKCLAPVRLDKYLMEQFPVLGVGRLNKALRENKIKLNGKKQPLSTRVAAGDEIKLFIPDAQLGLVSQEGRTVLRDNYDALCKRQAPSLHSIHFLLGQSQTQTKKKQTENRLSLHLKHPQFQSNC